MSHYRKIIDLRSPIVKGEIAVRCSAKDANELISNLFINLKYDRCLPAELLGEFSPTWHYDGRTTNTSCGKNINIPLLLLYYYVQVLTMSSLFPCILARMEIAVLSLGRALNWPMNLQKNQ